ncbi:hypothetical protein F2Q70_00019726 [Brassica cretica]|uniref:BSD domain-containing protein n=1 Tax=Brassica cretica TaxID=69181 RepID=A0A8S9GLH2_BRACR|nr:hypothetical protein F2Q70_00019726 [Brassica cretica]
MDHPIERLAPRLAALRIELCPCHMTVGYFWKVYFVLLHSRLGKHDAQLLSSPQVITSAQSYYHHHAPPEFLSPGIYAFEPPSIVYPDFQKTVTDDISSLALKEHETSSRVIMKPACCFALPRARINGTERKDLCRIKA